MKCPIFNPYVYPATTILITVEGNERRASVESRQVRRRAIFERTFVEMTRRYGGELRRIRRAMARVVAHKVWSERPEREKA